MNERKRKRDRERQRETERNEDSLKVKEDKLVTHKYTLICNQMANRHLLFFLLKVAKVKVKVKLKLKL